LVAAEGCFDDVLDVDATTTTGDGKGETRREDLQIRDSSPLVLVEVKGVAGFPSEAEALQVVKYMAPRMRELSRLDIIGLCIANHQRRNLPALDRNHESAFSKDVVTTAEQQQVGLLTAWTLYRLCRGVAVNSWPLDRVRSVLYRAGLIAPVPGHYTLVGEVYHYYPDAQVVSIAVRSESVRKGDLLAIEGPVDYHEFGCTELQQDRTPAVEVLPGARAGVKTPVDRGVCREGVRVFKVTR